MASRCRPSLRSHVRDRDARAEVLRREVQSTRDTRHARARSRRPRRGLPEEEERVRVRRVGLRRRRAAPRAPRESAPRASARRLLRRLPSVRHRGPWKSGLACSAHQRQMRPLATPKLRSFVAALALAAAAARCSGCPPLPPAAAGFPAPLDDVYIHFDFARSLAQGHPFEWMPGNGYSSGETSPLYAVVLAIGLARRLPRTTARRLGGDRRACSPSRRSCRSVQMRREALSALARRRRRACCSLSIGIVDWSLFSGMEVALFAAALGRTLLALARTRARHRRARRADPRGVAVASRGVGRRARAAPSRGRRARRRVRDRRSARRSAALRARRRAARARSRACSRRRSCSLRQSPRDRRRRSPRARS